MMIVHEDFDVESIGRRRRRGGDTSKIMTRGKKKRSTRTRTGRTRRRKEREQEEEEGAQEKHVITTGPVGPDHGRQSVLSRPGR